MAIHVFNFLSESEKSQHLLFCRVSMAQGIVQQFGLGEMACTICGDKVVATPPKVRQVGKLLLILSCCFKSCLEDNPIIFNQKVREKLN